MCDQCRLTKMAGMAYGHRGLVEAGLGGLHAFTVNMTDSMRECVSSLTSADANWPTTATLLGVMAGVTKGIFDWSDVTRVAGSDEEWKSFSDEDVLERKRLFFASEIGQELMTELEGWEANAIFFSEAKAWRDRTEVQMPPQSSQGLAALLNAMRDSVQDDDGNDLPLM